VDDPVLAVLLRVQEEPVAGAETRQQIPGRAGGIELLEIDTELLEHAVHGIAEAVLLEVVAASWREEHATAGVELVAPGVAAEVVVVVQDQDLLVRAGLLAIQIGRRQTADATAGDDEVVALVQNRGLGGPLAAPRHRMGDLVRSVVAPAHSGEDGRVVVAGDPTRRSRGLLQRQQISRGERRPSRQRERGTVEEVPPGDGLLHARNYDFDS
jgi:hypothetical protein